MFRPWLSRFSARLPALARQRTLAAVAVAATAVGTVGVVGIAVAVSASSDSGGRSATAGKTDPGSEGAGGMTGKNGGEDQGGSGGKGEIGPGSSVTGSGGGSSNGGGGSQAGGTSPGNPTSPTTVTTPTTPGYRPPPTPRTNADVDCAVTKCIALTFDDGPGPDTGRLLDLLKAQNVPATFFVLGEQAAKYPDLVRREYAEGNEVGNHTWDHKDLSKLTPAEIQDEITHGADAIAATGIPRPTLVRPPYGAVNDTVRAVGGFPFIMWRVDPEDWKYPDSARVAGQIVTHAKSGRIVLCHDTHATTVDAMPAVIERLKQQGYTFVTVSTLLKGVDLQNGQSYFNRPAA